MRFSLWLLSLSLLPFIAAATIPREARNVTVETRGAQEVIYLANCKVWVAPGPLGLYHTTAYWASLGVWWADVAKSLNQASQPDAISNEYSDWQQGQSPQEGTITWENANGDNGQHDLYFPSSGVTVYTHIQTWATTVSFQSWSGYAWRSGDWKYFDCYKDSGRSLFQTATYECTAIYYCL